MMYFVYGVCVKGGDMYMRENRSLYTVLRFVVLVVISYKNHINFLL